MSYQKDDAFVVHMTKGDLANMMKMVVAEAFETFKSINPKTAEDTEIVHGLDGVAKHFGCSKNTAQEYKKTYPEAFTQVGRKIRCNLKVLEYLMKNKKQ